MQTGNIEYIYKNDLDKACFQHDMTYGKFKDVIWFMVNLKIWIKEHIQIKF